MRSPAKVASAATFARNCLASSGLSARELRDNFGDHPAMMVLNGAKWRALDLRAGGRRARIRKEVALFGETLDLLEEQYNVASHLEADDMLDKMVEQLEVMGLDYVIRVLPWMLQNTEGQKLTRMHGPG